MPAALDGILRSRLRILTATGVDYGGLAPAMPRRVLQADSPPTRLDLGTTPVTAVPEFAAKLADLHGLELIAKVGWESWRPSAAYPRLRPVRLERSHKGAPARTPGAALGRTALVADLRPSGRGSVPGEHGVLGLLDAVPIGVLSVNDDQRDAITSTLSGLGIAPTLIGSTRVAGRRSATVIVVDNLVGRAEKSAPPRDFHVLAIVTTFNESDIIRSTIDALLADGVRVHVVDNWSTDGTFEILAAYAAADSVTVERFPEAPRSTFNHTELLRRVEVVSQHSDADWVIHHDADERRRSPWSALSLRAGLWTAHRSGFNAVNHTVLTFRPVDDGWTAGVDPEQYLRHFEIEPRSDLLLQIRAWRRGPSLELARSGGHEAEFPGRRVFPYRFLLKHYPLRSQAQAERKIFRERRRRWNPEERARGWHHHYDDVSVGQAFTWSPQELTEYVDDATQSDHIIPLVGGPEVGQPWALRARMRAIEDQYMVEQTARVTRRLEAVMGVRLADLAVRGLKGVAWIARPLRRAIARQHWRSRPPS